MRAAIRLDCAALPPGELIASATAFGLPRRNAASISGASPASVSAGAPKRGPRADDALEPQHRDAVAPAEEIERVLHRPDVGEPPAPGKAAPASGLRPGLPRGRS